MGRKELDRETGSKATFSVLSLELSNVLHNKTQNLSKREASKTRKTKQKQKQKKPNFMADMMAHACSSRTGEAEAGGSWWGREGEVTLL